MVDRLISDDYYQTEDQALLGVKGVYSTLYDYQYHKNNWPLTLPFFEDGMFNEDDSSQGYVSRNIHDATTTPVVGPWPVIYDGANYANELIARIPDIEFADENDKNRLMAESHFLRALYYYDLLRLYGRVYGLPYSDTPTECIEDTYSTILSPAEIYEKIEADLLYAVGNNEDGSTILPLRSELDEYGRATNGAARAFLAEVYLTQEKWQDAIDQAEIVVNSQQYTFLDNYADLWNIDNEGSTVKQEMIFAVPFFDDVEENLGSAMAYFFCAGGLSADGTAVSGNVNGKGSGNYCVQKWFIRFYQDDTDDLGYSDPTVGAYSALSSAGLYAKDYRIETTFWRDYQKVNGTMTSAYPVEDGGDDYGFIRKYIDPNGVANRTNGNDVPRWRLSDMYLIMAEAYNELNNYDAACSAIDAVRARVRKADGNSREYPKYISQSADDNIGRKLSQDEFRWLVFMERGLEFAGEQKRWFDLVRMKHSSGLDMYDYMRKIYIPTLDSSDVNAACVMVERKKNYPLPYTELIKDNNLKQNPGY